MTLRPHIAAHLLTAALLLSSAATAQQQPQPILLDPARGGSEAGARVADRVAEKDATLRLSQRLAPLLRARGFNVVTTRDTDINVTSDARAALANTSHPIACILLYATGTGRGVHLYTTALKPAAGDPAGPTPWDEAQSPHAGHSSVLAADIVEALKRAGIAASSAHTWMRPLDNMQCPAVALEVAPTKDGVTADDLTYQGHIADTLAGVLLAWRTHLQTLAPPPAPPAPVAPPAATVTTPAATPPTTVTKPPATTMPRPITPPRFPVAPLPPAPIQRVTP